MNIVELLTSTASRLPDQPVIYFKRARITYSELQEKVYHVAAGLKEQGVKKGMNVALMMTNRPEYIITYFAILANGGTVVPINPTFKEQEVTYIINDSESEILIMEDASKPVVENVLDQFKMIKTIINYSDIVDDRFLSWHQLDIDASISEIVTLHESDVAQIIYTSGTTGNPKGAMITHGNLNWMAITAAVYNRFVPKDRVLVVLPLFHAYAKLMGFLAPIAHGCSIFIEEKFHPVETLKAIAGNEITFFLGVPTMYAYFAQVRHLVGDLDFSKLRTAGSGGASLPEELLHKTNEWLGIDISEGYGLTESTVMLMTTHAYLPKKLNSVGLPLPGVDLKIVDAEGNEVADHEVGEVIFKGPNMMKGYYKKPDETENTIKDGWLYTGDLAYRDEDGYHFIVDRKKDIIIRGGFNIYPREIEELLYEHPAVVECSVIGRPDPVFGEKTVAYVVSKDAELTEEDVINYCKEKLAEYKVPDFVSFIEEIPKSGTGKILKTALKDLDKNVLPK